MKTKSLNDRLCLRIEEIQEYKKKVKYLEPEISYEYHLLNTLKGYYDDLEDHINMLVAVSRVQELLTSQTKDVTIWLNQQYKKDWEERRAKNKEKEQEQWLKGIKDAQKSLGNIFNGYRNKYVGNDSTDDLFDELEELLFHPKRSAE